MTQSKETSKKVATQASKILRDPSSTKAVKSVAGSALSQRQLALELTEQRCKGKVKSK
jgi:hypothetical protein